MHTQSIDMISLRFLNKSNLRFLISPNGCDESFLIDKYENNKESVYFIPGKLKIRN